MSIISKRAARFALSCLLLMFGLGAMAASYQSILFIGNSFTFGERTAVQFYHPDWVRDLNQEGKGGVPAIFKSFTRQAGLDYEVSMETHPGVGLDWHLAHKSDLLAQRPYDHVVMHGYSTLDAAKPGDPTLLIASVRDMTALLKKANPNVDVRLTSTWSRPDQTYPPNSPWAGKSIAAMAADVRSGYDQAAAATKDVHAVIPVGEAFTRAIRIGLADSNPYDGIDAGKFDLWTYDNYHASAFGYYLEALMVFGSVTGLDPRSLGEDECSAYELGISPEQAKALQQVAFDELSANGAAMTVASKLVRKGGPGGCGLAR